MKKIFTLFALLVCFAAQLSAQVEITNLGKVVGKNEDITFNLYDDDLLGIVGGFPENDPWFTNKGDETVELTIRVTPDRNSYNEILSWCGITGSCESINITNPLINFVERTINLAPGDSVKMALHPLFKVGEYRTSTATVKVSADNKYVTTFVLKYVYNETTAGVNDVKANAASVKVVGNELVYSFAAAGANSVSLYALDGKMVKHIAAAGQNGSVSLAGLQPGVYVCKANGNSSKVVVK